MGRISFLSGVILIVSREGQGFKGCVLRFGGRPFSCPDQLRIAYRMSRSGVCRLNARRGTRLRQFFLGELIS